MLLRGGVRDDFKSIATSVTLNPTVANLCQWSPS